jgi:imidazole glycerol-phosphate synthase subunit HisF
LDKNSNIRVIPRLDIKKDKLIKGVHLEGLRVIGDPSEFAHSYYTQGADELIYIDAVASLYGRNQILEFTKKVAQGVFIPITVGGGIRSLSDVKDALRSGADKVAINSAAVTNPRLIKQVAKHFGSQSIVLSVEAQKTQKQQWEVLVDNGREYTGMDVLTWVKKAIDLGAGEILLTSVDKEGTQSGFDLDLIETVSHSIHVPLIASGGAGRPSDFVEAIEAGASAAAIASCLHYGHSSIDDFKKAGIENKINVRP